MAALRARRLRLREALPLQLRNRAGDRGRTPPGRREGGLGLGIALLLVLAFCLPVLAQTAPSFPPLTGRVVDAAMALTPTDRAALEQKLKAHEDKTTDQVVVATVPSLDGLTVEDYANRLFRHWQLGQKAKNNGVLLVVAPNERKVRIEVGYGLEGALTDALTKVIIATAMAPRFKQGDFAGAINAGVDAIISILTGDAAEWHRRAEVRADDQTALDPVVVFVILVVLLFIIMRMMRGPGGPGRYHRTRNGGWIVIPAPSGGGWGGGFSGGGSWSDGGGGEFSGGGGSSGGGGASGEW